jgi:hypothetical protein
MRAVVLPRWQPEGSTGMGVRDGDGSAVELGETLVPMAEAAPTLARRARPAEGVRGALILPAVPL